MKDVIVFFSICASLVIIGIVGMHVTNDLAKASSKSPYSIEQCDQWLMSAVGSGSNQERTALATLSSACYLSQRKE